MLYEKTARVDKKQTQGKKVREERPPCAVKFSGARTLKTICRSPGIGSFYYSAKKKREKHFTIGEAILAKPETFTSVRARRWVAAGPAGLCRRGSVLRKSLVVPNILQFQLG